MIAETLRLLIPAFVLLVDDDDPQATQGGEDGGTGTDNDIGPPPGDEPPGIVSLAGGEGGMEDRNGSCGSLEAGAKTADQLRGEGYFGDKYERLLSPLQNALDGA
jgi:hypothetical protein